MPSIERPSGHTADGILEAACRARLDDGRRVRRWERAIYDIRLREELGVIQQLGLADYFLIVAEIADYAREHDIALVGRGSAVSSLVAHLLGVTAVDPIVHGLYFERFLHLGRLDPPDVDLDLPSDRRDEVIGWVFPSVRPRSRGDGVCPSKVPAAQRTPRRAQGLRHARGRCRPVLRAAPHGRR